MAFPLISYVCQYRQARPEYIVTLVRFENLWEEKSCSIVSLLFSLSFLICYTLESIVDSACMNKFLPASAFTLIEVLVVVSIMGILTALTIPKFSQFSSTRLLDRNARNLEIDINSLKVKAISGASQSSHNARWGIKINCNSSSYELGYSLDDGSGSYGAGVFIPH